MRTADILLNAFCEFSVERPWMLTAIIVVCILIGAAVDGGML